MKSDATGTERRGKTALTIAGFDSSSGAGFTADLLTFASFGIFATAAPTALTVQSTRGVRRVDPVDASFLRETLQELEADLPADGIKIGMLGTAAQVQVVADYVAVVRNARPVTVVLDPVLVSSSGAVLLDDAGLLALREDLLPLVDALTPNTSEAAVLGNRFCRDREEAKLCAGRLAESYPNTVVLITGGHLDPPSDLVWQQGTGVWLEGERIVSSATHGTGCAYSSALLASRLNGCDWVSAARSAKQFVTGAIRSAIPRGSGRGPMNLFWEDEELPCAEGKP